MNTVTEINPSVYAAVREAIGFRGSKTQRQLMNIAIRKAMAQGIAEIPALAEVAMHQRREAEKMQSAQRAGEHARLDAARAEKEQDDARADADAIASVTPLRGPLWKKAMSQWVPAYSGRFSRSTFSACTDFGGQGRVILTPGDYQTWTAARERRRLRGCVCVDRYRSDAGPTPAMLELRAKAAVIRREREQKRASRERANRTRKLNRADGPVAELLRSLRAAQAASDEAKEMAANGIHFRDYAEMDQSDYARSNYYRSRQARASRYRQKSSLIAQACELAPAAGIVFGWQADRLNFAVYFDLPTGQVSFHCPCRGAGPDYEGQWDGITSASSDRIESAIAAL
jgi:hypothetical protein